MHTYGPSDREPDPETFAGLISFFLTGHETVFRQPVFLYNVVKII
jgi:hypothetical protein